jgi:urea transport system ATP-binding protein
LTPDLLKKGAERVAGHAKREVESTESGGRSAGYGRVMQDADEVDVTHGRILYLEDVSVSFDGFKAINKLSLDIAPGELRCIIGPNGAGKTTLFNLLNGFQAASGGQVQLLGQATTGLKPNALCRLGMGRTACTGDVGSEDRVLPHTHPPT